MLCVRLGVIGIALMSYATTALSSECNCNKWPYVPDPPCFNQCAVDIVLKSDPDRLKATLNLPEPLAQKVIALRAQALLPKSFDDLASQLSPQEAKALETRIRQLSPAQFERLRQ